MIYKVFLFLFLSPTILLGEEFPENKVIQRLQKVAVMVKAKFSTSSGNIINRGDYSWVITAAHGVEDNRKEVTEGMKKKVSFEDVELIQKTTSEGRIVGQISLYAEVIRYSEKEDLALLRVRKKKAFPVSIKSYEGKTIPPVGTTIYHIGSPLGESGANSLIHGMIASHGRLIENKVFDQVDCNAFPGSSGGAITLKDGRMIGVILRGKEGGFALMAPIRRIRDWAKRVKVDFLFDENQKIPDLENLRKNIEEKE